MVIKINGDVKEFVEPISVQELLTSLNVLDTRGLAIAVNGSVVSKQAWSNAPLKNNDEVLMITATKGG